MIRHAGLIARRLAGHWRGVLVEGPSGAGKSDLMLRALDLGFRLVADDRVLAWRSGEALYGRAPRPLAGLIEVRGLGLVRVSPVAFARIVLVVADGPDERMPDPAQLEMEAIGVHRLTLPFRHASTPAKIGRALERVSTAP